MPRRIWCVLLALCVLLLLCCSCDEVPDPTDDFVVDDGVTAPTTPDEALVFSLPYSHDDTLDTDATLHGYITVTPMTINRTHPELYRSLQEICV